MTKVRILTPEWNRSFEAEAIFLPGALGEFEILTGHAPIISALTAGTIRWRSEEKEDSLKVSGGVARLDGGVLDICTAPGDDK